MTLAMKYKLAVTMNNIGASLVDQSIDNNNSSQYAVATGLFRHALQTLRLPDNAQNTEESYLPRQLLALSSLLAQSNMVRNNFSTIGDATLSHQPTYSSSSSFFLVHHAVKLTVTTDHTDSCHANLAIAAILFNLALLHQLTEPYAPDVPDLYHTCAATLRDIDDSNETFLLAVACLNNVGVWCHATGDALGAQSTMEQLSGLMATEDEYGLEEPVLRGVQSNIICTLEGMADAPCLAGAA